MSASAQPQESVNPKSGMTQTEATATWTLLRSSPIMARIFRRALRSEQSGRCKYVGGAYSKFPDIHVEILDLIAADDKVVVRNRWAGTEAATGKEFQFSGMADRAPATGGTLGVP